MISVAETWVEAPLKRFVDDARVTFALLIYPSGQVLGQSGFARAVDVMSAAALAAGIHATVRELGRSFGPKGFRDVFHAGVKRRLYLAELTSPRGPCVLLTVFDDQSSLGLVQLYFEELRTALAQTKVPVPDAAPMLDENFELELNRNLAMLFGRAPGRRNITPTS
jgi:Roadblock/LC7 domain